MDNQCIREILDEWDNSNVSNALNRKLVLSSVLRDAITTLGIYSVLVGNGNLDDVSGPAKQCLTKIRKELDKSDNLSQYAILKEE